MEESHLFRVLDVRGTSYLFHYLFRINRLAHRKQCLHKTGLYSSNFEIEYKSKLRKVRSKLRINN